jgi:hypothetical protein
MSLAYDFLAVDRDIPCDIHNLNRGVLIIKKHQWCRFPLISRSRNMTFASLSRDYFNFRSAFNFKELPEGGTI